MVRLSAYTMNAVLKVIRGTSVYKKLSWSQRRLALQRVVRHSVTNSVSRKCLNNIYTKLSWSQKRAFHGAFAKIFREHKSTIPSSSWIVEFAGKPIEMPLRPEWLWLDWDSAVSICGHDIEVKQTYCSLIQSSTRPEQFVDIGANYGTHSLLFLIQGIETITIEPNSSCHDHFRTMCRLNGVKPYIKGVALGERTDLVELCYPERDTWFGSTDIDTRRNLEAGGQVIIQAVAQKTMDDYLIEYADRRLLFKIDTEGNECAILKGGYRTLTEKRPLVIFESLIDGTHRDELFQIISEFNYRIAKLPWASDKPEQTLTRTQFLESARSNFIAVPEE